MVGFSLGSNLLVKYLGEQGTTSSITAALSVGNPFNLLNTSSHLSSNVFYKYVYNANMAKGLKALALRIKDVFHGHPHINISDVLKTVTVQEFDELYTRRIFGYDTISSYYQDASCDKHISTVCTPLLCINSLDDPISISSSIPYDDLVDNHNVILITTQHGGHLGFFQGQSWLSKEPKVWITDVADQYFSCILKMTKNQVLPINGLKVKDDVKERTVIRPKVKKKNHVESSFYQQFVAEERLKKQHKNRMKEEISPEYNTSSYSDNEEPHRVTAAHVMSDKKEEGEEEEEDGSDDEEDTVWEDPSTYVALGAMALLSYSSWKQKFRF